MKYSTIALSAVAVLVPAVALAGSHGTTTLDYGQNPAFGATGAIPVPTYIGDSVPLAYTVKATTPLTVRVAHSDGGLFCAKVADVKVCSGGPTNCMIQKIGADGLCNFSGNDATFVLTSPDVSAYSAKCMTATARGVNGWRGNVSGTTVSAELRYKNGDVETVYGPAPLVALSCDKASCDWPNVGPYVSTKFPPDPSIAPKATVGVPYRTVIWQGGWLAHWVLASTPPPGLNVSNLGVLEGTLGKAPTMTRSYTWTLSPSFRCPSWDSPVTYPLKIELPVNDLIGPHADVTFEPANLSFEGGPMKLVAHVTDNWGIKLASARFTFPDGHVTGLPLTKTSGTTAKDQIWSATYTEPANQDAQPRVLHVRVTATDDDDNTTQSDDATYTVPGKPARPTFTTPPPGRTVPR